MLLFWRQKLVLLAVPKTGTTALEAALLPHASAAILNPPQKKHVVASRYRNQLAPFFEDKGARRLELMAVVREPLDWLSSWYRYRARDAIAGSPTSTAAISFDQFVEGWLSETPPEYARVGRQSRFVSNAQGEVIVDHIFAYEALHQAVDFLQERLAVRIDLARKNVSPTPAVFLSPTLRARLDREASVDFNLWHKVRSRQA